MTVAAQQELDLTIGPADNLEYSQPTERIPFSLLREALGEFIINWPLYSQFTVLLEQPIIESAFKLPDSITRPCPLCTEVPTTTWGLVPPYRDVRLASVHPGYVVTYQCMQCDKASHRVWFTMELLEKVESERVADCYRGVRLRKLGQWPPHSINPPREVERQLSEDHLRLYKNGLVCLSQGYGIGALGYFRRVVEETVHELLNILAQEAKQTGNDDRLVAITYAQGQARAEDKLRLAADILPESLRPGDVNPLAVLYQQYSRGIHGLSDEECLEIAIRLRFAFEYVFERLPASIEEARKFREAIQSWAPPQSQSSQTASDDG